MAGTIVAASPLITRLEGQSLGYNGTTLSNFDSDLEPQIIGNLEIAGSIASFASLESITGWAALSNGTVYIKVVPDTTAGTCTAEFTATAPTWDNAKMGWYGTGANANHRYLFKLTKGGASLWEDKRYLPKGSSENLYIEGSAEITGTASTGALTCPTINTGNGAVECYAMDQNVRTTDSPTFASINTGTALKTKVFSIGDWNMDWTPSVSVAHGLTVSKIRDISALILSDVSDPWMLVGSQVDGTLGGSIKANSTYVILLRTSGGVFDSTQFDSTGFNRGWITITYIP